MTDRAEPRTVSVDRIAAAVLCVLGAWLGASIAWRGIELQYVGRADSAHTISVARALMEGRGFTVDYVAHHFRSWPAAAHPEDSFPLLHPLVVGSLGLLTRDPVTAAHVFGGLVVVAGFAGLPLLVQRWWGTAAACVTAATLVALEQLGSYFERPLNDAPATVFIGFAALLVLRAIEIERPREANRMLVVGALVAGLATQIKPSSGAFVLALAAVLLVDGSSAWKRRVGRASLLVAIVALAHVPTVAWHWSAHGELGIPNNAVGRNLARELGAREDFWDQWERARTYLPGHPHEVLTTSAWIERDGAWTALVVGPLARARRALDHALLRSQVIPYAMLLPIAWAAARPAPRSAPARALLLAVLTAPLLAVYSHYEPRYFHPLRPLCALAVGSIVRDYRAAARGATASRIDQVALGLLVIGLSLGAAGWDRWRIDTIAVVGLLGGLGIAIAGTVRRAARDAATGLVMRLAAPATLAVSIACAAGVPRGIARLSRPPPRYDDAALGAWIASVTRPSDVVVSRRVPELALFSRRAHVMLPYHTDDVCVVARRYGAAWLLVEPGDVDRQAGLARFVSDLPSAASRGRTTLLPLRCHP